MATKKDLIVTLAVDDKGTVKIKKVLRDVQAETARATKVSKSHSAQMDKDTVTYEKARSGLSKFRNMMKGNFAAIAAGMGTAMLFSSVISGIKNAISKLVATGREFEREWANVTTMMTLSGAETAKYRQQLLNLPPILGKTADLARGMYQVLSASIEPAEAINFLTAAAKAAVGGVTDTKTAVNALTTVINAYGLSATDVTRISDIMFQTVKRGKLTYEGMAGAIGTVVPIAAQVGIGFEEIAAAMASLTRVGVDVNTTTVQLRQVMVSVLKPTKQARDEAERLGLEFTAAALRTKGLVKFLSEVMKKTKGSSTSLTQLFGNVRALTGVMGLAGKSAIGFAYDLELMKNASGASTEAFKKQIVTSDAQIKMFNETVNKWAINFYAGFVRNFEMSSEAMDEWNRKVAIQNKQMDKTGDVLGLIITKGFQYHPLLQSISALTKDQATAEVQLEEAIRKKNEQISIFVTGFSPMANAVGIAINIYGQLMSQIVESNLPIGQQLDLLAKLRKEYFKLPPPVDKVTEAFEALKMKMKTELKGELLTLIENFDLVRGSGEATEKGIVTLAKKIVKLGNEVKVKLRPEFYRLAAVTKEVKESMAKLEEVMTPVKRVFDSVKLTLLEFTGYLDPKLKQALYITEKGFESLGVRVKLDFIDIIHQAKPALESAIWSGQGFERGMKVITTKVSSYWKRVVSDMARAFETAFTSMLDEAKSFADAFNALIRGMLSVFATVMGKIVSEWVTSFGKIKNAEKDTRESMISGVIEMERTSVEAAKNVNDAWMAAFAAMAAYVGLNILDQLVNMLAAIGSSQGLLTKEQLAGGGGAVPGLLSEADKLLKWAADFETALAKGTDAIVDFLIAYRKEGIELGKVTDYILGQLDRIPAALNTLILNAVPDRFIHITMGQFYKLTDWVGKFMDKFEESLALDPSKVLNTDAWKAHVDRLKRILGEELFSQFEKWMKKMGKSWGDLTEWMHENEDALAAVVDKYKKRLDDLAQLTVYTFHKMIAEGRGWLETLRAMQDPLRSLIEQYEQLGLTIPKVLVPMKKLLDLMELKPRIFENLDAAVGILESLGNAAYMNQEIFNTLAKSVTNFARAFLGVTGSLREFMSVAGQLKSWQKQVLTPLVAQFVGMAAIFGLRVPGWMKEFVTTQLGVNWKEFRDTAKEQANMARASLDKLKDLNKKNLQLVNRATKRNDLIRDTNRGIGDVVDAVRELGRTAGTKVTKAQTGFGPEWVRGPRSFYIEPGAEELVNIIPKGRTGATGGQQPIVVNTNIKPVVVPGPNGSWLIKFLQEAADNERLTFNPKSIRSQ